MFLKILFYQARHRLMVTVLLWLLMMGGMLPPDSGAVRWKAESLYHGPISRRNRYRRETVGFVFQRFHLFPYLSVADNIRLPLTFQEKAVDGEDVERLAVRLGIQDRLRHRPSQLSVGEQQRTAVARALAGGRELILADEPTGNLDTENAAIIANCLLEECRRGRTVVVATHDPSLLAIGGRRIPVVSGRLGDVPAS